MFKKTNANQSVMINVKFVKLQENVSTVLMDMVQIKTELARSMNATSMLLFVYYVPMTTVVLVVLLDMSPINVFAKPNAITNVKLVPTPQMSVLNVLMDIPLEIMVLVYLVKFPTVINVYGLTNVLLVPLDMFQMEMVVNHIVAMYALIVSCQTNVYLAQTPIA